MGAGRHAIKHKPAIGVCIGAQLVAAAGEQQQLYGAAPLDRDGLEAVRCTQCVSTSDCCW
jgi:imidazoleglycerol phosphate synthase glutamine amidotransferase subunit HisH